jgi:hypothetical protein
MKTAQQNTTTAPNKLRRTTLAGSAALIVAIGWTCLPAAAAKLVEVRVGTNNVVSDAPFFIANKKGEKAPAEKPKPAAPPASPPAGGLSLPPARGGSAEVPAAGLGMARLPKVEPAGASAPGAPDENPFSLPVARNLGPKPGESLFAPPPSAAEPKLPDAKPKDAPSPRAGEPVKEPPPRRIEEPKKELSTPRRIDPPKRAPIEPPKPEPAEAAEEEADDELSSALFLPSSTKEIVVEAPAKQRKPEPREPPDLGLDLVHELHGLNDADHLPDVDVLTRLDERRRIGRRRAVEGADHG